MMKRMIVAGALALASITPAHAVEIEALGTGTATAPSTRTQIMFRPLGDDKTLEALAAKDAADGRAKLLGAIRRVDPSVKPVANPKLPPMGGLESLIAMAGPPEAFEIASAKASAVKSMIGTTYGSSLDPLLTPVSGDQSALRREALKLAIADAETRARDLAAAAGLKLGPMLRVRDGEGAGGGGAGAFGGLAGLMALGAKGEEQPKTASVTASVVVTFDAGK